MMSRETWRAATACLFLVGGLVAWMRADYFGHELLTQIAILAIFAMSLDLLAGFTGMISLGHAAFYGLGAYATAAFNVMLEWSPLAAMAGAVANRCCRRICYWQLRGPVKRRVLHHGDARRG